MRFTIRHLLIATGLIAAFLGCAVTYGIGIATILSVLTALAFYCVRRVYRRWRDLGVLMRIYAAVTAVASSVLLLLAMLGVVTNPTLANERKARTLQAALHRDSRFATVNVMPWRGKSSVINIRGRVRTDADFKVLRQEVTSYDWHEVDIISWDVEVTSLAKKYEGSDEMLFGERFIGDRRSESAQSLQPLETEEISRAEKCLQSIGIERKFKVVDYFVGGVDRLGLELYPNDSTRSSIRVVLARTAYGWEVWHPEEEKRLLEWVQQDP